MTKEIFLLNVRTAASGRRCPENVSWQNEEGRNHEIFGDALPETAVYNCPHCGAQWSNELKNRAVKHGEWRATAPFTGIAGFYINELYSPFPGSSLAEIAKKYLTPVTTAL